MFKIISLILSLGFFASFAQSNDQIDFTIPIDKFYQDSSLSNFHNPQRGEEFNEFLSNSLKIIVGDSMGSGTIIYYDKEKNLAYVASCGHLWQKGIMSEEEGKKLNLNCTVVAFYQNEKKLNEPKQYKANVIFYSFLTGQDTSLMTFTPDWQPKYLPIAPKNYIYKTGTRVHSLGCDFGSEVAHYEVEIIGTNNRNDIETRYNSPRGGRSGGGLFDEKNYIGTCWGTEFKDGSGIGFYTSLSVIHNFWNKQKNYNFLLTIGISKKAQKIKIIDKNNKQKEYNMNYIIMPK